MTVDVFAPEHFRLPAIRFRPLQMHHAVDRDLHLDREKWDEDRHRLDDEGVRRRLNDWCQAGGGGIITNVGYEGYLQNPEAWSTFRDAIEHAVALDLAVWIYDEKGYPSGTAGGIVTRSNPAFVAAGLACYQQRVPAAETVCIDQPVSCRRPLWVGAVADTDNADRASVLDLTGSLDEWGTLRWTAPDRDWTVLYLAERPMYEGTHASSNASEFRAYLNLLDAEAVHAFLRVTYERYRRELGDELFHHVKAIFTDEPAFMTTYVPELPPRFLGQVNKLDDLLFTDRPPAVPWHRDLPERFEAEHGYPLLTNAWALFLSESADAHQVRHDFWQTVSELYSSACYRQMGDWCRARGVAFTGHMFAEESLIGNVRFHGDLYRVLREFTIPGVDLLNAKPQSIVAGSGVMSIKLVSSAAHIIGAGQVMCECSDWGNRNDGVIASLAERIGQGNVLFALGVNVFASYYSWDELGEEAARQYNLHMARLASLLTGGRHVCDVAVLYPIRSMWSHHLPPLEPPRSWSDQPPPRCGRMVELSDGYFDTVHNLLQHQIDLDIIDEQGLEQADLRGKRLHMGEESYDTVVLPPSDLIGAGAASILQHFADAGGQVMCVETSPALPDDPTRRPFPVINIAELVRHLRQHQQPPDVQLAQPDPNIICNHRILDGRDIYFIVNAGPEQVSIQPTLRATGPWQIHDPATGSITAAPSTPVELGAFGGLVFVNEGQP